MGSDEMLGFLRYKSRDNSRTPMQWDAGKNAGFSEGEPWIMVNPNYREINAAEQLSRPDSVFRFYQELIRLRHTHKLIVYGSYDLHPARGQAAVRLHPHARGPAPALRREPL